MSQWYNIIGIQQSNDEDGNGVLIKYHQPATENTLSDKRNVWLTNDQFMELISKDNEVFNLLMTDGYVHHSMQINVSPSNEILALGIDMID